MAPPSASSPAGTPPDPSSRSATARPRDLQRVLLGYLAVALALLGGLPVALLGSVAASHCRGEGFRCLGWFVYGLAAAAAVAAVALLLLARRLRLGLWWALLTLACTASCLLLGDGSLNAGTAFLAPGLAAWVSEPPDPGSPGRESSVRHWGPRWAAVLVLIVLIPALGRVI